MLKNITSDNSNMQVKVEHVEEDMLSLKLYVQKISFKEVKHIEKIEQGSKVDLQILDLKVKVEHIEEKTLLKIGIIIDWIYN